MLAIMANASMTKDTCRCQPCQDRVSLWSRPSIVLGALKAVLDGPAAALDLDQLEEAGLVQHQHRIGVSRKRSGVTKAVLA